MTTPSKEELVARYGEPDDLADAGDCDNQDRAEWAWQAIQAFMEATHNTAYTRATFENLSSGAVLEVVGDLICDLLHFATMCGENPDAVIGSGLRHFEAEVGLGYSNES